MRKLGHFLDLQDYVPIAETSIPSQSLDLVTCHIGLHHCPDNRLEGFLQSIHRILKPGGKFIMREHDVTTAEMASFVSLVHTVFNLGLQESWAFNDGEYRSFKSIETWCQYISERGFTDSGPRLLQDKDPSLNTLVLFTKN